MNTYGKTERDVTVLSASEIGQENISAGKGKSYLLQGDCLDWLETFDINSIDTLITDPPAGISFMSKSWDGDKGGRDKWIEWLTEILEECLRVLKPGAMALVWALPRTSHWTATAIENAGFEIRDIVMHIFGSGFPKSHSIGKGIDKAGGAEREVVGVNEGVNVYLKDNRHAFGESMVSNEYEKSPITAPATDAAKLWDGWGTALKPAAEHWILAMKPRDGTFAENALKWGVAGINVDGGRIASDSPVQESYGMTGWKEDHYQKGAGRKYQNKGRWPANVILDESAAAALDEQSGVSKSPQTYKRNADGFNDSIYGDGMGESLGKESLNFGDTGGAARFFYVAKASRRERNAGLEGMEKKAGKAEPSRKEGGNPILGNTTSGAVVKSQNHHPTVKPLALMRYLCKLTATPTGGIVLDPFMGSGSTGMAAVMEGRDFIGIEMEEEYMEIAEKRIEWAEKQPIQGELF